MIKPNGTITRKVVVFQKRDNEYLVFLMVYGFEVQPDEPMMGNVFQDKLPLYIIPESKLQEHMDLFRKTFYNIVVEDTERFEDYAERMDDNV